MDFRLTKFRLAVAILLAGLAVAIAYHGWQGVVLKRDYPYNTFLFRPGARYSDFTDTVLYLTTGAPYRLAGGQNNHFPADYLIFRAFSGLPGPRGAAVFVAIVCVGIFVLLLATFRPLFPRLPGRALAAIVFLLSYPCLIGFDRANSEIVLALLIGFSLFCYWKKKFGISFFALLLPICFKLYPIALLLLFVRRRLIGWVVLLPFAFAAITWLALLIFIDPPLESLHWFFRQLVDYNVRYNLGQDGISAGASAWNLTRFGTWAARALFGHAEWPMPFNVLVLALKLYDGVMALLGCFLVFHVLLVERTFARRAILLLLYLTVSVPGGGNYKLMHVVTALVILILIPGKRRLDLAAVATLAFAVIPKQEVLFPYFGASDSLVPDCSIAVILNPLALLVGMGLILWPAYDELSRLRLSQRLRKLAAVFHLIRVEGTSGV